MTTATITTDIHIGAFKIPSNGQNMIMNDYARRNKIPIEFVIPEPIMSNELATTLWCHEDYKFSNIIMCSIHQLPKNKKKFDQLIKKTKDIKFHFALEGISGKGSIFLKKCFKEIEVFDKAKKIDSSKTNWIKLYKLFKESYS